MSHSDRTKTKQMVLLYLELFYGHKMLFYMQNDTLPLCRRKWRPDATKQVFCDLQMLGGPRHYLTVKCPASETHRVSNARGLPREYARGWNWLVHYITLHYIIWYCIHCIYIVLYYIISYHIILYYVILYYIILYYIILYYIILYYIILYYIILYYIILYYIILYYIILYYIILYYIILYYIILYYIILYYIILYCIILYYIILYCIILYFTIWLTDFACCDWSIPGP